MPKFIVNKGFQFAGYVRREGATLEISKADLTVEMQRGVHPTSKKMLSGLLNHCSPADEETMGFLAGGGIKAALAEEDDPETAQREIDVLRAEMDRLGIACDKRWGLDKIKIELKKAKKEKGL